VTLVGAVDVSLKRTSQQGRTQKPIGILLRPGKVLTEKQKSTKLRKKETGRMTMRSHLAASVDVEFAFTAIPVQAY
jgi:hypothetical protein